MPRKVKNNPPDDFTSDLITALNKEHGTKVAYNLANDTSPTHVNRWISTGSKQLDYIIDNRKNDLNIETIISKLKPPIFWKDKPIIIQQSKKWDKKKIQKALDKIYDAELKIKSNSSIRNDLLVKNLIVDLCYEANAA